MILNVITYNDHIFNILRKKNIDVKIENPFLQELILDMFETIDHYNFKLLTAPQVNHNLKMFIIKHNNIKEIFINPSVRYSGLLYQIKETSDVFPNMIFPVKRYEYVEIYYFNNKWKKVYNKYNSEISYLIQQGFDLINNKLVCD